MEHVYDRLHKKAILLRIIWWGLFILLAAGFIIFTCLFFKSKSMLTALNTSTYHIFMIIFGVFAILTFIIACLSLNIRYGRYKIDNHFLTVYSGFVKNAVYLDEEIKENKCGPVVKMEVLQPGGIPIYVTCNIFGKITVKFNNIKVEETNRY